MKLPLKTGLFITGSLLLQNLLFAQISTSEVKVEQTNNITSINGRTNILGLTRSNGLFIPGRYSIDKAEGAIEFGISNSDYNAIRGYNGNQHIGTIHFFDDTWGSGLPSSSAGSINIAGLTAVTIGTWNNPAAYFRNTDGFVGIGTTNPSQKLSVTGVTLTNGLRIPGRYTFGQGESGIEIEIPSGSYNVIRGYNGSQHLGAVHFFDDTWGSGSPSSSAGSTNISGLTAVTIGTWSSPAAYFRSSDGFVGIGTTSPNEKLHVNGNIRANGQVGWPDFVFESSYQLKPLEKVEKFINEQGHLEDIPTQEDVLKNGIDLTEMDALLLQKIEELTLYMIELNKRVESLEKENKELKRKLAR